MLPDRVSNPGPLTYESGALPIVLRGPSKHAKKSTYKKQRQDELNDTPYITTLCEFVPNFTPFLTSGLVHPYAFERVHFCI